MIYDIVKIWPSLFCLELWHQRLCILGLLESLSWQFSFPGSPRLSLATQTLSLEWSLPEKTALFGISSPCLMSIHVQVPFVVRISPDEDHPKPCTQKFQILFVPSLRFTFPGVLFTRATYIFPSSLVVPTYTALWGISSSRLHGTHFIATFSKMVKF